MIDTDADVVVAGAGAAGLAAALSAAQSGREVLLVERSASFRSGSNTSMSTAMIPAGGSRWQDAAGIDDSPARFREDIVRKTGGSADPVLTDALTRVAPRLVDWLADRCDVPLELVTDFSYPGHSRDRCHAVPDRAGRTLHAHLLRALEAHEGITFACPMRLEDVSATDAAVDGVRLVTPDGRTDEISCRAVVLGTNGFGANDRLVARHLPEIAEGRYHGGDGSIGDALRIGARLGADTAFLDAYQGHGSVAVPHGVLLTWATIMHGAVLVNGDGRRFGDETTGYSEFGALVVDQPGSVAWTVYDARIDELCRPFADYQDLLAQDAVKWARDTDELAAIIGCDPPSISATIETADAAAHGAAADPLGRVDWEAPLVPPYAVVKVTGALFHTQGGLAVDGRARVLSDGRPVPGLYAAGGAAAGISGHGAAGYLAGNGLLSALGLGYLAGLDLDAYPR